MFHLECIKKDGKCELDMKMFFSDIDFQFSSHSQSKFHVRIYEKENEIESEKQKISGNEMEIELYCCELYSGRVVAKVETFCCSQSRKLVNWCNSVLSTLIDSLNLLLVSLGCIMMS